MKTAGLSRRLSRVIVAQFTESILAGKENIWNSRVETH